MKLQQEQQVFVKPNLRKEKGQSVRNQVPRVMRTEQRGFGHMPKNQMKDGYIVIGSSYTQAADPNSMRNFGPNRNAVFNIRQSDNEKVSNGANSNRDIQTSNRQKRKSMNLNPYDFYTVVKQADCTKNVSQSIFMPGHLPSDYYADRQQPDKNDHSDTKSQATATSSTRFKTERPKSVQMNYGPMYKSRIGNDSTDIAKTLGRLDDYGNEAYINRTKQSFQLQQRREPEKGRLNSALRPRIPKQRNYAKIDREIMKLAKEIEKGPTKQSNGEKTEKQAQKSGDDRYKKLRDQIREEKRLKNQLRNELQQMRVEMERRLDLVNLKMSYSGQNNMGENGQE